MSERQTPYIYSAERDGQPVRFVRLTDGRDVAFRRTGSGPNTVIDLHGNPGSRLNPMLSSGRLYTLNVNVISFDRPGFGESTPNPGRKIADTAADVEQLVDALGIERFGVRAQSGGVPHAVGCAALLGDRVSAMICSSGLAPKEENPDWDNMTAYNKEKYRLASENPERLEVQLTPYTQLLVSNRFALYDDISPEFSKPDSNLLGRDFWLRNAVARSHAESLKHGVQGWLDEIMALNNEGGWGFNPRGIRCPTVFWHGESDPFADQSQSTTLRTLVPGSASVIQPAMGHFGSLMQAAKGLAYLNDRMIHEQATGRREQMPKEDLERLFTANWFESYRTAVGLPETPTVVMHGSEP